MPYNSRYTKEAILGAEDRSRTCNPLIVGILRFERKLVCYRLLKVNGCLILTLLTFSRNAKIRLSGLICVQVRCSTIKATSAVYVEDRGVEPLTPRMQI